MARLGCYCTGGRLSNEGRIGRANERARVSSPVPSRACVVARTCRRARRSVLDNREAVFSKGQGIFHVAKAKAKSPRNCFSSFCREGATTLRDARGTTTALKHSVDMSLPGIGEDFSLLDTIIAELPELFYAEILPKLDLISTLNLAQVNKSCRDAVWSVDNVRSMEAKMDAYNDINPRPDWVPSIHVVPMYWAVRYGNVPAVKALLKSGLDVNKGVPPNVGTPLFYAAFRGHVSIVALLLDAGANAQDISNWRHTPLEVARARGYKEVVELLKAAGA